MRPGGFFLAIGATLLGATCPVAATRQVPSEYATIQAAIDASAVGDTVLVAPGTYTDVSDGSCGQVCVCLKDGVIVRSSGGSTVTVIDMNGAAGHAMIRASGLTSPLTLLEGFTITGAASGVGGAYLFGRITIRDCRFRDLTGYHVAAGLWCRGDVTLIQCEFENCVSDNFAGAAVYHGGGGHIEMYDCSMRECGNRAAWLDWNLEYPIPSAHVEGCTFEDCWQSGPTGSGALAISGYFNGATVRNCRFLRNRGAGPSGAVSISGFGPKLVEGCLFVDNSAPGPNGGGGGLHIHGPATVRGNTFYGNTCTSPQGGGAIRFSGGYPCQLLNNVIVACAGSGAIEAYQVPLGSACNVFWDNPAGVGDYYTPGPTDRIVDPLFCDVAANDFRVMVGSPCLPEGSIGCELIGAYGQGCGVISIEPTTWGRIKAEYRDNSPRR